MIEVLPESNPILVMALKCRTYGYVALEKYEQALIDIKGCKKIAKKLDVDLLYNKNMSKGILRMDVEDYLMACKYFTKAWKLQPHIKDAYCLQIISIVTSYTYSLQTFSIDQKIKYDKVNETRQFVSKAINAISKPDSSLLFFRGLLSYQLHNFAEAYEDFSAAIRKEQSAMYYTARGRTLACLSLLEEAMDDLSTAIKLDEH